MNHWAYFTETQMNIKMFVYKLLALAKMAATANQT